jgi:hypothetical protein
MPDWVVVYETTDLTDGHVIAGRLEVAGIRAYIHQQPGASALGIRVGLLGEITVSVPEAEYDNALLLLEAEDVGELPDSTEPVTYYVEDEDE